MVSSVEKQSLWTPYVLSSAFWDPFLLQCNAACDMLSSSNIQDAHGRLTHVNNAKQETYSLPFILCYFHHLGTCILGYTGENDQYLYLIQFESNRRRTILVSNSPSYYSCMYTLHRDLVLHGENSVWHNLAYPSVSTNPSVMFWDRVKHNHRNAVRHKTSRSRETG